MKAGCSPQRHRDTEKSQEQADIELEITPFYRVRHRGYGEHGENLKKRQKSRAVGTATKLLALGWFLARNCLQVARTACLRARLGKRRDDSTGHVTEPRPPGSGFATLTRLRRSFSTLGMLGTAGEPALPHGASALLTSNSLGKCLRLSVVHVPSTTAIVPRAPPSERSWRQSPALSRGSKGTSGRPP